MFSDEPEEPEAGTSNQSRSPLNSTSAPRILQQDDEELDAPGEDKGLDYRQLAALAKKLDPTSKGIIIPKRGEKDFEPLEKGVNVQERALTASRTAMFNALRGVRGGSLKSISHAYLPPPIPLPSSSQTVLSIKSLSSYPYILISRANHTNSIGTSVRGPPPPPLLPGQPKIPREPPKVHLLPEEALYLVERGSLIIHSGAEVPRLSKDGLPEDEDEDEKDVQLTLQQSWSLFLPMMRNPKEYVVYAQLKRLGYIVRRNESYVPPVLRPPMPVVEDKKGLVKSTEASIWLVGIWGLMRRFNGGFRRWFSGLWISQVVVGNLRTLVNPLATSYRSKSSLFRSLRVIPTTSPATMHPQKEEENPYRPVFDVWKPNSTFKKSDPGPPDFRVGVVDAKESPFPPLEFLEPIFSDCEPLSAPAPRSYAPNSTTKSKSASMPKKPQQSQRPSPPPAPWWSRYLVSPRKKGEQDLPKGASGNSFPVLKQGDRSFILAVVEGGSISWLRLGRGVFGEWAIQ